MSMRLKAYVIFGFLLFILFVMSFCRKIDLEHCNIDVLCMVRNSSSYVKDLTKKLDNIKRKYPNYKLKVYLFENNSTDDTVKQCNILLKKHDGILYVDDFDNNQFKNREQSKRRMLYMANLRQTFKNRVGMLDSKYVFILDTDTDFGVDTFHNMISTIKNDETIGCVTPFTLNNRKLPSGVNAGHYFDTLALIINGKRYWPKCPFDTCSLHKGEVCSKGIIEVDSAFNGLCLMYTKFYNQCNYFPEPDDMCEHDAFNKQFRKVSNKKIVIDTNIKLTML